MSRDHVQAQYATPQALSAPAGPIHVGWWDAPHADLARAERDYEDHLLAPLALSPGIRLLDLGCGFGALARRVARERGCEVDGVDVVAHHVATGAAACAEAGLADRVRLHHGDARALPFDDASFDAAVALEVLLHVPDRPAVARELARVLRPGALVAVSDYLVHPPDRRLHALARAALGFGPLGTEDEYVASFEAAGFERVDARDVSDRTLLAFYDWSIATGHADLRRFVARTVAPWLGGAAPLAVHLGRWSASRGGWGLHFLTLRRR